MSSTRGSGRSFELGECNVDGRYALMYDERHAVGRCPWCAPEAWSTPPCQHHPHPSQSHEQPRDEHETTNINPNIQHRNEEQHPRSEVEMVSCRWISMTASFTVDAGTPPPEAPPFACCLAGAARSKAGRPWNNNAGTERPHVQHQRQSINPANRAHESPESHNGAA